MFSKPPTPADSRGARQRRGARSKQQVSRNQGQETREQDARISGARGKLQEPETREQEGQEASCKNKRANRQLYAVSSLWQGGRFWKPESCSLELVSNRSRKRR